MVAHPPCLPSYCLQAAVGSTLPTSVSIESVAGDEPPAPPSLGQSDTSSQQAIPHQEAKPSSQGPSSAGGGSIAAPPAGPAPEEGGLATQPCSTAATSPAAAQAVSCLGGIATPVDRVVACVQHVKFVVIDACAVHNQIDLEAEAVARSAGLPGAAVALPPQGADMGDATGSAAGAEAGTAGTAGTAATAGTTNQGTAPSKALRQQGSGIAAGSLSRSSTGGLSECDHMGPTARHLAAELAGALDASAHIVLVWSAPNSTPAPPPAAAYTPSAAASSDKPAGGAATAHPSAAATATSTGATDPTNSAFGPAAEKGVPEQQQGGQAGKTSLQRSFSSREWVLCSMLDAVIKAQPGIKVLHVASSSPDANGARTPGTSLPSPDPQHHSGNGQPQGATSGPGPAPHGVQHMVCSLSAHVTAEDVRRVELMLMMTGRAVIPCPSPGKHRPLAVNRHH
jgi:hypothetical protein